MARVSMSVYFIRACRLVNLTYEATLTIPCICKEEKEERSLERVHLLHLQVSTDSFGIQPWGPANARQKKKIHVSVCVLFTCVRGLVHFACSHNGPPRHCLFQEQTTWSVVIQEQHVQRWFRCIHIALPSAACQSHSSRAIVICFHSHSWFHLLKTHVLSGCLHYLRRAVFLSFSAHDFPWVLRGKFRTMR